MQFFERQTQTQTHTELETEKPTNNQIEREILRIKQKFNSNST